MLHASNIRMFDPLSGDGWDTLAAAHPAASFFHTSSWARVLHATYGHVPHYLGLMDGDRPRVLMPILEVNSPLTGRRGVTLPFSDECGPLVFDGVDRKDMFEQMLALGGRRGWKYLEVRGNILDGMQPARWISFIGHEVDLSGGRESLFDRFDASVRRAVRKAEKAGVQTRILGTLEGTRVYYTLHCGTRQKHGVPPQSFSFFRNMFELVLKEGSGFIMVALHSGRPIAAGVFVHNGRSGLYKFGASDREELHLRGNDLVMWEAMKWYAGRGYTTFSMGRTDVTNEGLRRFKRGFGAREHAIDYFRYDLRRRCFVAGLLGNSGAVTQLLRLTPLPIFRMMGSVMYPHLH